MSVHWWMAGCYGLLFVGGTLMAQVSDAFPGRSALYDIHKSIGVLTLALLSWRILVLLQVWWRKYTKRWPTLTGNWWRTVVLHTSLYGFMWAVPIAGFLLSNSYRANNVKFFGWVLPDIFPVDSSRVGLGRGLHFWLAYTFLAFILLHAIAQWKVVRANWRRLQQFLQRCLKSMAHDR